jgi:hypothetical protein
VTIPVPSTVIPQALRSTRLLARRVWKPTQCWSHDCAAHQTVGAADQHGIDVIRRPLICTREDLSPCATGETGVTEGTVGKGGTGFTGAATEEGLLPSVVYQMVVLASRTSIRKRDPLRAGNVSVGREMSARYVPVPASGNVFPVQLGRLGGLLLVSIFQQPPWIVWNLIPDAADILKMLLLKVSFRFESTRCHWENGCTRPNSCSSWDR